MPLLQVRDFPQDLYDALAKLAERENRSITQQVIYTMKHSLEDEEILEVRKPQSKVARKELFEKIRMTQSYFSSKAQMLDTVAMIREDRER